MTTSTNGSARDAVLQSLTEDLQELSGLLRSEIDADSTFLQMGFDSLFLTQVAQTFKKSTKVDIAFRQLLADAPTLNLLADYVLERMPEPPAASAAPAAEPTIAEPAADEPVVEPEPATTPPFASSPQAAAQQQPAAQPQPAMSFPPMSLPPVTGEIGDGVERVISEQLALMAQQLQVLGGIPATPPVPPLAAPTGDSGGATKPVPNDDCPLGTPGKPSVAGSTVLAPEAVTAQAETGSKQVGPWKPADTSTSSGMTDRQAAALQDLISRYVSRTPKSKGQTQQHRSYFADARAVSGFRNDWKEMVYPIISERSKGSRIWDTDGNEYIDMTMGFGSVLFGHSPEFITDALKRQLDLGVEIGPQSNMAGDLARELCEMAGIERVAYCNTGSEAVLVAMRLARTATARDKVVVFEGDYHGIFDEVLARAGANGKSMPIAPGIPASAVGNIIVLDRNDPEVIDKIRAQAGSLAAVLVEPVPSRTPDLQSPEFLRSLREVTEDTNIALIFDEIITGFRLHPKGARGAFDVEADIVTYGKVLGGGMPIGIIGGKAKYLDGLDGGMWQFGDDSFPEKGMTFFAGTFVRHPLAVAAASSVVSELKRRGPEFQEMLNQRASELNSRVNAIFEDNHVAARLQQCGSQFHLRFTDQNRFNSLLFFMLREKGVHIWEGRPIFISDAHTPEDFDRVASAFESSVSEMREAGFWDDGGEHTDSDRLTEEADSSEEKGVAGYAPVSSFPLTEIQEEIWTASRLDTDASRSFTQNVMMRLKGEFNLPVMRSALQDIVDRHDGLRTTFDADGRYQSVQDSLKLDVQFEDHSSLGREDAELYALDKVANQPEFDLENGPLVRATIFKLSDGEHLLAFSVHHLVFDGWAFHVFMLNLREFYSARLNDREPKLKDVVQMSQYAAWLADHEKGEQGASTERYWLDRFSDSVPQLELPTDHARQAVRTFNGGAERIYIDRTLADAVKKVGAANGCTQFTTMLGTYSALLHRLTGQDDVVTGILMSGQSMTGIVDMIGHGVHTLPIRSIPGKDQSFAEFLRTINLSVLDARDHWAYTFGTLVKKLDIERSAGRVPLVSALFNLDPGLENLNYADIDAKLLPDPNRFSRPDLFFNLIDTKDGLTLDCQYNADLFDSSTIRRWMDHYVTMLNGIVSDPDQPLSRIPLLSDEQQTRVLEEWNDTGRSPAVRPVLDQITEAVEKSPEKIALKCGDESIDYLSMAAVSQRIARHLGSIGIGPGKYVGIYMERSIDFVISILGIIKSGAAYVPIEAPHPVDRLSRLVTEAGLALVLTDEKSQLDLTVAGVETLLIDEIRQGKSQDDQTSVDPKILPSDPVYVIFTSGSTGTPKGVVVEHRHLDNYIDVCNRDLRLLDGDSYAIVSSLMADVAHTMLFPALVNGGTLHLIRKETAISPPLLSEYFRQERIDFLALVPSYYVALLGEAENSDLVPMRSVFIGGEQLPVSLARRIKKLSPNTAVVNLYGPAETTVSATSHVVTARDLESADRPIPVGRPLPGSRIYILDRELQPVPVGLPGEIYIGGAQVARGYIGDEKATATKFVADPFAGTPGARMYRTGDVGMFREDGNVVFIGRSDNQVKVSGYRVELGEIETALRGHKFVRNAVCSVVETSSGHTGLIGYLVAETGQKIDDSEVREYLGNLVPSYMVPSTLITLDALPLNANGKVDRSALPAVSSAEPETVAVLPEMSHSQQIIVDQWKSLLGIDSVSSTDTFYGVGGNSLQLIRFIGTIEKTTGVRLSPRDVMLDSLGQLAARIEPKSVDTSNRTESISISEHPVALATRWAEDSNSRSAPEIRPVFFGEENSELFGCLHTAKNGSATGQPVVICHPLGREYERSHMGLRRLAENLAAEGHSALRFDMRGFGDSALDSEEADPQKWTSDIRVAQASAMDWSGSTNATVVGLRFGATLAALAGASSGKTERMVMWDPIVDGSKHIDDMVAQTVSLHSGTSSSDHEVPGVDLQGVCYSHETVESIRNIDLRKLDSSPAREILLIETDTQSPLDELAKHLESLGAVVELRKISSPGIWSDQSKAMVPANVISEISSWIGSKD